MNLHEMLLAPKMSGKNNGNANLSDYYTKSQTDGFLSEKVDKVSGKGLSTNDFTDVLKAKLTNLGNYNDSELRDMVNSLNATVGYKKRNLVSTIHPETDQYIGGITFTFGDDGVVTARGTADNDVLFKITEDISDYKTTPLILSGCPLGGSYPTGYALMAANSDYGLEHFAIDIGFNNHFSIPPHVNKWNVYCYIHTGITVNNLTFEPMVRYASDTDNTYEPYRPSVLEYITSLEERIAVLEDRI